MGFTADRLAAMKSGAENAFDEGGSAGAGGGTGEGEVSR